MKILVALQPGFTGEPALERAKAIASRSGSELVLFSSVYDSALSKSRRGDRRAMATAREAVMSAERGTLEGIAEALRGAVTQLEVDVSWDHPPTQAIARAVARHNADLVVISSTRHHTTSRRFLSNTDWDILRYAAVPVLVAHHQSFEDYGTVLAAVDPMHEHHKSAALDDRIIAKAKQAALWFDGLTHLGHAYPSAKTVITADYAPPAGVLDNWREDHTAALRALGKKHAIDEQRQHLADDKPLVAIPELADSVAANLVVLGVVSRSFPDELWIGRITEHLIDRLSCDVLTVK